MQPLLRFFETDWYSGVPAMILVFVVLGVAVMRLAPADRKKVLRIASLFAVAIVAIFAAGILDALGYVKASSYTREAGVVAAAISIILVSGAFVFDVIFPRLRLFPPAILQDVLLVVTMIAFGLIRLSEKGMDPGSLFTTSALITAVVALSLQDTLGNILGGLALQIDQSIKVGDWVQIDSTAGHVVEIGWRQTSIETNNWETMVVPNSVLVKNRFLVLGRRTGQPIQHRRWVPFYVDSQYSPDQVIEAVQGALRSMDIPSVAKTPAPQCFLLDLAENPVRYSVSYWLTDLLSMNPGDSSIRIQTYLALKRAGIPIAVPARNVLLTEDSLEKRERKWEQELEQRMAAIEPVDIFEGFAPEELHRLAERIQPAPYLTGDVLVRQGTKGTRLYVIVKGHADVFVENERGERAKVAALAPGDYFGEMALMTGEPRTATVIARTNVLTYRLDKDGFRDLLVSRPDVAEQISTQLAKRRSELEATRENLDEQAAAARAAANHRDIRQKIWQFFGLDDSPRSGRH